MEESLRKMCQQVMEQDQHRPGCGRMVGSGHTRGPNIVCLLATRGGEEAPRGVPHTPVTLCGELREAR
jgi:hypothetical protein